MMFRHWRLQVSLICFTLLLAVIVLWVRSYSWRDELYGLPIGNGTLVIVSQAGVLAFVTLAPSDNDIEGDTHIPAGLVAIIRDCGRS
jgi:hypothetical protein